MPDDRDTAIALLREHVTQLEDQWREYHTYISNELMPLVRRERPDILIKLMEQVLATTWRMPVQVPDLKSDGNKRIAALKMNQSKASLSPLETGLDAKKDIGQTETWLRALLNKLNKGREFDHWKSECQVFYGVGATRFCYDEIPEPDDDALEEYVSVYRMEDGDSKPKGAANEYATGLEYKERARQEYYCDCMSKFVHLKYPNPLTVMWGPDLNDPGIFIEKAKISYAEFKRLKTRDEKGLTIDKAGKVYILGAGFNEDVEEQPAYQQEQYFNYIRENIRDPATGKWHCREFVCMDGKDYADGEIVQEYEIPFEYPEYIICASGFEQMTEQNPFKRYEPIIKELAAYCHELNILLTLQLELAIAEASGAGEYVEIKAGAGQGPIAQLFRDSGFDVQEGAGATGDSVWVARGRVDGSQEKIPAYPGQVNLLPRFMSQALQPRIDWLLNVGIPQAKESRFLVGAVGERESAGAPASTIAMQSQAAALPNNNHLAKQDEAGEQLSWSIVSLVRNIDKGVEPAMQKVYPMVATGNEGPGVKPGETIEVTAFKLRRKFDIAVFTKRETLAEELQIWARADADLERFRIGLEEYFEKRGYPDPLQHIEDMNQERQRAATSEQFQEEERQERGLLRMLLSGITPPQPMAVDPATGQPLGAGGGPGGAPTGDLTTVPQPRPVVAPPAVGGVQGGSSGFV